MCAVLKEPTPFPQPGKSGPRPRDCANTVTLLYRHTRLLICSSYVPVVDVESRLSIGLTLAFGSSNIVSGTSASGGQLRDRKSL
jgi:hypothetical protein